MLALRSSRRLFTNRASRSGVGGILHRVLNADDPGGIDLSISEISALLHARGATAWQVLAAADELRQRSVGSGVSYVVNRNINFTNTCVKKCGFCAFSRTGAQQEAYHLPLDEVVGRAREAMDLGATEVCVQAGLPPGMPADLYFRTATAIKEACPDIQIHGFSPEEVLYASKTGGISVRQVLEQLRDAGVTSLPGTSAEVLVPRVRDRLAAARISVEEWTDVVRTAHSVGLPTTSTVMYGHCETAPELAQHLLHLRDLQRASTGSVGGIKTEGAVGITEFVPLSFVAADAPIARGRQEHAARLAEGSLETGDQTGSAEALLPGSGRRKPPPMPIRGGPSGEQVLLLHAVARLALNRDVPNVQASWVKEGSRMAQLLLQAGCNDLGGTLINESISTAAGAKHGQLMKPSQIRSLVRGLNPAMAWGDGSGTDWDGSGSDGSVVQEEEEGEKRYPWQRDTGYTRLQVFPAHVTDVEAAREAAMEPLEAVNTEGQAVEQRFGSFFALAASTEHRFRDNVRKGRAGTRRSGRQQHQQQQAMRGMSTSSRGNAGTAPKAPLSHRGITQSAAWGAQPGRRLRPVTYSPSYTVVPTYECFNRCTYCNFRTNSLEATTRRPAEGSEESVDTATWGWMQDGEARKRLRSLRSEDFRRAYAGAEVREALILSGEVSPRSWRRPVFVDRLERLARVSLEEGLLPHTNAGPLSEAEMGRLRASNVSMGLMLEQLTPKLVDKASGVHRFAPSKRDPRARLDQIAQAGRLKVPFTTGILCGIGENERDREESLEAIAEADALGGGHVQEVIVQPHAPGADQMDDSLGLFSHEDLLRAVGAARQVFPPRVIVQVPPNLTLAQSIASDSCSGGKSSREFTAPELLERADTVAVSLSSSGEGDRILACLDAGASDLGGISPLDEVNPSHAFPVVSGLQAFLRRHGYALLPRLPIHDSYIDTEEGLSKWVDEALHSTVRAHLAAVEREREAAIGSRPTVVTYRQQGDKDGGMRAQVGEQRNGVSRGVAMS